MQNRMLPIMLALILFGVAGCASTSRQEEGETTPYGKSNPGASAHQQAWEKGRVPEELQNNGQKLPPVEATQTTTSTTAPTGEMESNPTGQKLPE
jgi:hypothetical protein